MSEIKRYEHYIDGFDSSDMAPTDDGDYVLYTDHIAALEAVKTTERERCAQIAEGRSKSFDFQKALADYDDMAYGTNTTRTEIALAIRSGSALEAKQSPATMKLDITREWFEKRAAAEGDLEIGAGSRKTMTLNLTDAELAKLEKLANPEAASLRIALEANQQVIWRPITEADNGIAYIVEAAGIRMGNSYPIWARDSDGRVFECLWADDGKRAYWWDIEGESPVDPVEFMPHPLAALSDKGDAS